LQAEEIQRERKLILDGKLPVNEKCKEMMEHPVFKVSQLRKKSLKKKMVKVSAAAHFTPLLR
jgi:hypothetical protein